MMVDFINLGKRQALISKIVRYHLDYQSSSAGAIYY